MSQPNATAATAADDEVEGLFAAALASGHWQSLAQLQSSIPDDLAEAKCQSTNPLVYADLPDPKEYGRHALAAEAVKALEASGDFEVRETAGQRELCRLKASEAAPPPSPVAEKSEEPTTPQPPTEVSDEAPVTPAEPAALAADAAVPPAPPPPAIDPEFAALLPPLTAEEAAQLEANLLADGVCHDPLVSWKGPGSSWAGTTACRSAWRTTSRSPFGSWRCLPARQPSAGSSAIS